MALTNPRLAAGVGVFAAFLVLSGSGAALAVADPDGSHGGSSQGDGNGRGNGQDHEKRSDSRSGDDESSDNVAGSARGSATDNSNSEGPKTRVGSGRDDTPTPAASVRSGAETGSSSADSGDAGPAASGSDPADPAGPTFEPPRVTFGNGRTPGAASGDQQPGWQVPEPPPAPPAPPPVPPPVPPPPSLQLPVAPPTWVDRVTAPPTVVRQFVVAPAAQLTDPMSGVAGLLLISAAGAALGYRQARTAQAAERLGRT